MKMGRRSNLGGKEHHILQGFVGHGKDFGCTHSKKKLCRAEQKDVI
jgi:hypothetical protein